MEEIIIYLICAVVSVFLTLRKVYIECEEVSLTDVIFALLANILWPLVLFALLLIELNKVKLTKKK